MSTDESEYVAAHVQEALARDPRVNEPELGVTVANGRVVINGLLPTDQRRRAVTEVVHECCPDLDIENRTTVGHFPYADGMETLP